MKKILSIIMAIAILCGMCAVPAGAEDVDVDDMATVYFGLVEEYKENVRGDFGAIYSNIYDIDKNGVPELIMIDYALPTSSDIYVFSYEDGEGKKLGMYNGGRIGLYEYENNGFLVSYTMDGYGTMELVSIIDDEICYIDEWEITGSSDLNSYEAIERVENNYNSIKNAISKAIAEYESNSINVEFSGKCGDSVYYTIKDGVLDITGTGEINTYHDELPWVKNPNIIERIIIHDGINWIGNDHMFSGLNSLTYVSMPDTLEYISQGTFAMCENLEEIALPDNVDLGWSVFSCCSSLKKVKFSDKMTSLKIGTFAGCSQMEELEIPEGIEAIGDGCFEDCYNLKKLILPKSLESIDAAGLLYSFKNCDNLTIYGYANTYAESYSKEKGIPFVILDDSYDDVNSITVTLNDNKIYFDQSPIIQNDRTLVPMRAIFEAMGCEVQWYGEYQAVDVWRGEENVMTLWIGDNEMWTPNGNITLDVPPQVINDRTLVPVRAISESMGAKVFWRGGKNEVEICYYPPYSGTTPNEYYYRNQSDIVNFGHFLNDNPHLAGDFGYAFYNYTYDSNSNIEFCLAKYFDAMENEGYSVEYVKNEHGSDFYQIVGNGYEIEVVNDDLLEHIEIRILE